MFDVVSLSFEGFAPLQFFIVLFTKSCLRLYLVQLMSTIFLMSTLVWQKIPSGLFKITKYIKYLYIYLQKQEVITTGYFSVSCNRMIIIEIDSKFPPHSTVFFLRNYAVVILAHFQKILTTCKFGVQSWYCPYHILLMTEC